MLVSFSKDAFQDRKYNNMCRLTSINILTHT